MKINIYVIIEFINTLARYKYLIFFLSIQFQETKFVLTHRNTHPTLKGLFRHLKQDGAKWQKNRLLIQF